jgi:hypothetical protein
MTQILKKIGLGLFLSLMIFIQGASGIGQAHAINPSGRLMITTASYGTACGAVLGAASMAYGTRIRAIAVGASLGLYAGLLFGGYILVSHSYLNKKQLAPVLPDNSPYQLDDRSDGGGGFGGQSSNSGAFHWDPSVVHSQIEEKKSETRSFGTEYKVPLLYFDFFNYNF